MLKICPRMLVRREMTSSACFTPTLSPQNKSLCIKKCVLDITISGKT